MASPDEMDGRDHLADAESGISALRSQLPLSLDLKTIGRSSLLPAKIVVLRSVLGHRVVNVADDAVHLLRTGSMVSAVLLTRACMETTAALHSLSWRVERFLEAPNVQDLDRFLMSLIRGSRDKSTGFESRNALTLVDSAEKQWPGFRGQYDSMSEFVHPNFAGVTASYSRTDWQNGHVDLSATAHQLPRDGVSPLLAGVVDIALAAYGDLVRSDDGIIRLLDGDEHA